MKLPVMILYTLAGVLFVLIRSQPIINDRTTEIGMIGQILLAFVFFGMPAVYLLESRARKDPDKLFQQWKKRTEERAQMKTESPAGRS